MNNGGDIKLRVGVLTLTLMLFFTGMVTIIQNVNAIPVQVVHAATLTVEDPVAITVYKGQTAWWELTLKNTGNDYDHFIIQPGSETPDSIPWSLLNVSDRVVMGNDMDVFNDTYIDPTHWGVAAGSSLPIYVSFKVPFDWFVTSQTTGYFSISVASTYDGIVLATVQLQMTIIPKTPPEYNEMVTLHDEYEELAYRWAPVWYQDTNANHYRADYITRFDYDGDWRGDNNWDDYSNFFDLYAYVYYSVVETETHWFIGYYDFHPRDWSKWGNWMDPRSGATTQHENDMEGALLVVKKTGGEGWGELVALITEAHGHFYQYVAPSSGVVGNEEDLEGNIESEGMESTLNFAHPRLYVEAQGHGVFGNRDDSWSETDFPGHDGVVYYPGVTYEPIGDHFTPTMAEYPEGGNDRSVSYLLIDLADPFYGEGLWDKRFGPYGDGYTFGSYYAFDGDGGTLMGVDAANPPWQWDDSNDGDTWTGEIITDPANLVSKEFGNLGEFSGTYVNYDPYVRDDDKSGPRFRDSNTEPMSWVQPGIDRIRFTAGIYDQRGVSSAWLLYRLASPDGTERGDWNYLYYPKSMATTGHLTTVTFEIKEIPIVNEPKIVEYQYWALDNDSDFLCDKLENYSQIFTGPTIVPIVGKNPSVGKNIIAFQTNEDEVNSDLNGDGDAVDSVIRYINLTKTDGESLSSWQPKLVNTGAVGEFPSVNEGNIAFQTIEDAIGEDLNGDGMISGNAVIRYFNEQTGLLVNTGWAGCNPSMSGNLIAFEVEVVPNSPPRGAPSQELEYDIFVGDIETGIVKDGPSVFSLPWVGPSISGEILAYEMDGRIHFYNVSSEEGYWDIAEGMNPAIDSDLIAFTSPSGHICYLRISDPYTIIDTTIEGDRPSVWDDIIVFETTSGVVQYIHLANGRLVDTSEVGESPSVSGIYEIMMMSPFWIACQATEMIGGTSGNETYGNVIRFMEEREGHRLWPGIDLRARFRLIARPGSFLGRLPEVILGIPRVELPGKVSIIPVPTPPLPPIGLMPVGDALQISTTAQIVGPFTVTVPYDPPLVTTEQNLKLMQVSPVTGQWNDITVNVDTINKNVIGIALHFSVFGVFEMVDTTPPSTTIKMMPQVYTSPTGTIYVSSITQFSLRARDTESGIASTTYRIRNNNYDSGWLEALYPWNFRLDGFTDGTYDIDYRSTNIVGATEPTHTITVVLDNSRPLLVLVNPQWGSSLNGTVTFVVSASDQCGIHAPCFSIRRAIGDQEIPIGLEDIPTFFNATTHMWELPFNTLQLPDGVITVLVSAEDNLGHNATTACLYAIQNWEAPTPPSAPLFLNAIEMDGQITLTWSSPSRPGSSEITGYIIYRSDNSGEEMQWAAVGNVLACTDANPPEREVHYRVSAVSIAGEGSKSNEVSLSLAAVPSAPTGLGASIGELVVRLNWSSPEYCGPGPLTYHLLRDGVEIWNGTTMWYNDTAVEGGKVYEYRVSATNSLGNGQASGAVLVAPLPQLTVLLLIIIVGALIGCTGIIIVLRRRR